jgi:hypothetical protein
MLLAGCSAPTVFREGWCKGVGAEHPPYTYEVTAKAGGRTKNVRVSLPPSGATATVTMD